MGVYVPVVDIPGNAATATSAAQATKLSNDSGSAPSYACRAWVNFNGTGTVAIRGSGNVSSITDNGTGDYTVNFSTAMADANYCAQIAAGRGSFAGGVVGIISPMNANPTASAYRLMTYTSGVAYYDAEFVAAAFFR